MIEKINIATSKTCSRPSSSTYPAANLYNSMNNVNIGSPPHIVGIQTDTPVRKPLNGGDFVHILYDRYQIYKSFLIFVKQKERAFDTMQRTLSSGASIKNLAAEFGRFIREARETKGRLQADVAEKLGVSRSYYGHIESGNREIYSMPVINICRVLDLDMNEFMKMLK